MNNQNIVLNSSNYDSDRRLFSYKLPNPRRFMNSQVGLVSCVLYKQFDNISSEYNNNTIQIKWLGVTYTLIIEDGYYTIEQISSEIDFFCFTNGLYYTSGTDSIFLINLAVIPSIYGAQFTIYGIPNASEATSVEPNYVIPDSASWTFPEERINPEITFNSEFGKLIGFSGGTYGQGSSKKKIKSSLTPAIEIVSALTIQTNLINNHDVTPPSILSSMSVVGEYGSPLTKESSQILYSNISNNNFHEINVWFSNQDFTILKIKDTQVIIHLSIIDL